MSPLGTIGGWLNELVENNDGVLLSKVCIFLDSTYERGDDFGRDLKNEFCVWLFWRLNYPTIEKIKFFLDQKS